MMNKFKAERLQSRIAVVGRKLYNDGTAFHRLVRSFRESGAWAVTSQNHSSFTAWCVWFAPRISMAATTLITYGGPNYKLRREKAKTNSGDMLSITGDAVKWLRRAIRAAHDGGVAERRDGIKKAIIAISKFYIRGMK